MSTLLLLKEVDRRRKEGERVVLVCDLLTDYDTHQSPFLNNLIHLPLLTQIQYVSALFSNHQRDQELTTERL